MKNYYEIDGNNLEEVNEFRVSEGKQPLNSVDGYCMSTGCSCSQKRRPMCGLFMNYDEDGIKKDFVWQILGV